MLTYMKFSEGPTYQCVPDAYAMLCNELTNECFNWTGQELADKIKELMEVAA